MSSPGLPLDFPPSDIVRDLAERLDDGVERTILDAGCGSGRNSVFLAELGHRVIGMSDKLVEVQDLTRRLGHLAGRSFGVVGDVRNLPFRERFDIVLSNEVMHQLPKTGTFQALEAMRDLTHQGGLNVVSGYLVVPGRATIRNAARCFHPSELHDIYAAAGWDIISYNEQMLPHQYVGPGGKEQVQSRAKLIAQRPWTQS